MRVDGLPPAPRRADFTVAQYEALSLLFSHLGGTGTLPVLRTGAWDLWVDGVLVELDEAQHFNRYRAQTLTAPWTAGLPWAQQYRQYCLDREGDCLKKASNRKYWTSKSTEAWFGPSAPRGDLDSPGGSARWKQRAFYDAVKDAWATWRGQPVARLSVHDDLGGVPLGTALGGRRELDLDALLDLLRRRTTTPSAVRTG